MELKKNKVFNPEGSDFDKANKRIIGGNTTNLIEFADVKYDWAYPKWYRAGMNNFWIPEEIVMSQDQKDFRNLSPSHREIFENVISFLQFLDSAQVINLPNINDFITASEVKLCLTVHTFQEAVHAQSYAHILNSVCSPEESKRITYLWRDNPMLLARNKFIGDLYDEFALNPTNWGLVKSAFANFILEGIYFYSGFMTFYSFGRLGLLPSTVQQIRYINRDELTHLGLFRNILRTIRSENPELFTPEHIQELENMMQVAVETEIAWGQNIIGNKLEGITPDLIDKYIKFVSNNRMNMLDMPGLYPEVTEDPMKWIAQVANSNNVKVDFFEGQVTAYTKASSLNWKDL